MPAGINSNPMKVKAILNYPVPQTEQEIKQYLGLGDFFGNLLKTLPRLPKAVKMFKMVRGILKYGIKVILNAIDALKNFLTEDYISLSKIMLLHFTITTDASNVALRAGLSQQRHPICFVCYSLNQDEFNYSATKKNNDKTSYQNLLRKNFSLFDETVNGLQSFLVFQ